MPNKPPAPDDPNAPSALTSTKASGAEPMPERPAPHKPPPPVRLQSPEAWAAEKGTPDWALAATRARHLLPETPGRAAWLPNGQLSEADFDRAVETTLNGSLR